MKELTSKMAISKMVIVLAMRYKDIYEKAMPSFRKEKLRLDLTESLEKKGLSYKLLPNGELGYFIHFRKAYMGEFKETFFYLRDCYCADDPSMRRQFYKCISKAALAMKAEDKVKRMVISVSVDDTLSKKYFEKKGILTYTELVGSTKKGLRSLSRVDLNTSKIKIVKIQESDIHSVAKKDLESHIQDKTSRMHEVSKKTDGKKLMMDFYKMFLRKADKNYPCACYVAKDKKKILGSIAYFIDVNERIGLIASVFVASKFQGMGLSKLLYKKALMDFSQRKLGHYFGSSTTKRVLTQSISMGRRPIVNAYIVKI